MPSKTISSGKSGNISMKWTQSQKWWHYLTASFRKNNFNVSTGTNRMLIVEITECWITDSSNSKFIKRFGRKQRSKNSKRPNKRKMKVEWTTHNHVNFGGFFVHQNIIKTVTKFSVQHKRKQIRKMLFLEDYLESMYFAVNYFINPFFLNFNTWYFYNKMIF